MPRAGGCWAGFAVTALLGAVGQTSGSSGRAGGFIPCDRRGKKCLNENWEAKTYIKLLGCQQQGSACTTRNSSKFLLVARRHLLGEVSWQLQALVVPTLALKVSEEAETGLSVL